MAKKRIALVPSFAHNPPMLPSFLSRAVNGIEAFPVEVDVNSGWGDTDVVISQPIRSRSSSAEKGAEARRSVSTESVV